MEDFPTIITDRLILTKLNVDNLSDLAKYANNKHIASNVVNIPFPYTAVNASMRLGYVTKGFAEKSRFCFAILLKDTQAFIGEVSLHETDKDRQIAELGYWIGEPFWSNGYTSEAVGAIIPFGFNSAHYKTIYATCKPDNMASKKILTNNKLKIVENKSLHLVFAITANEFQGE